MVTQSRIMHLRKRLEKGGLTKGQINAFGKTLSKGPVSLTWDDLFSRASKCKRFAYFIGSQKQTSSLKPDPAVRAAFIAFTGVKNMNLNKIRRHVSAISGKIDDETFLIWSASSSGKKPVVQAIFGYK